MKIALEIEVPQTQVNPVIENLLKELTHQADIVERMFDATTRTWSDKNKPQWKREYVGFFPGSGVSRKDGLAIVSTDSKPFVWVEARENPGRVGFSRDYRPKTRVRTIGSGSGAGRVTVRGARAPVSNVKARDFRFEIAERRQSPFEKAIDSAIRRGSTKFFYGTKIKTVKVINV